MFAISRPCISFYFILWVPCASLHPTSYLSWHSFFLCYSFFVCLFCFVLFFPLFVKKNLNAPKPSTFQLLAKRLKVGTVAAAVGTCCFHGLVELLSFVDQMFLSSSPAQQETTNMAGTWQPRIILLGMVEARSVNSKSTHTKRYFHRR